MMYKFLLPITAAMIPGALSLYIPPHMIPYHQSSPCRNRITLRQPIYNNLSANRNEQNFTEDPTDKEMRMMERDVRIKTREKLDEKIITEAFTKPSRKADQIDESNNVQIAIASGGVVSFLMFLVFKSVILSGVVFGLAVIAALGDPMEEEGITGALTRVVGRVTLKSIKETEPRIKSVARAALVDVNSEVEELRRRVEYLERENEELKRQMKLRDAVEEALPRYSLEELRFMARKRGLMVGGSKAALLTRLFENDGLDY